MEWFDVSTFLDMVYFDKGILDSCHMRLCLVFVFNFMPIINQWWCCKFWRDLNFVSLFVMYIIELLNENAGQFETLLNGAIMNQYRFSGWNYTTHFFKFHNWFITKDQWFSHTYYDCRGFKNKMPSRVNFNLFSHWMIIVWIWAFLCGFEVDAMEWHWVFLWEHVMHVCHMKILLT